MADIEDYIKYTEGAVMIRVRDTKKMFFLAS